MPNKLTALVSIGFWLVPCIAFVKVGYWGLDVCKREITKPSSARTDGDRIGLGMLLVVVGAGMALMCWVNISHHVTALLTSPPNEALLLAAPGD